MPYSWDAPFEVRDIRNGEWYWVQKEVLSSKKINASDKLVYSALAYFSNNKTQECFPSYTQICKLVDLSRNTVIKAIRKLIKHKFISKKKKEGRSNFYDLLKVTSAKFGLVPNGYTTSAKENHHPTQNKTSNNNYLTRINNNKERVEKIKEKIRNKLKPFPVTRELNI